jgi:hypothetical protein
MEKWISHSFCTAVGMSEKSVDISALEQQDLPKLIRKMALHDTYYGWCVV